MIEIPGFATKSELFEFLVTNKKKLIAQKKADLHKGDTYIYSPKCFNVKKNANKELSSADIEGLDEITVVTIMSTNNFMDSHQDVHIKGNWDKTLKEATYHMHLQEHRMKFDHIIADADEVSVKMINISWKDLGFNYGGMTEALQYTSLVKRSRNEYMFGEYAKGHVRNHSVGMRYVKLVMAINNDKYGAEYEAWEKYYPLIVNKEVADETGYFWAVKEARLIEGSAVVRGSNIATPTQEIKTEPLKNTQKTKPSSDTLIKSMDYFIKHY